MLSSEGSLPEALVDAVGLYQSESVSESGASIGHWGDSARLDSVKKLPKNVNIFAEFAIFWQKFAKFVREKMIFL